MSGYSVSKKVMSSLMLFTCILLIVVISDSSRGESVTIDFLPGSGSWGSYFEYGYGGWSYGSTVTNDDFDDTSETIDWTSSDGIYSSIRTDEDLNDGTTKKGAWCSAAAEEGNILFAEDSRGYAWVSTSFDFSDYITTPNSNQYSITNAYLQFDYKAYSSDFDDSNNYLQFYPMIKKGSDEWTARTHYWTGGSSNLDASSNDYKVYSMGGEQLEDFLNQYTDQDGIIVDFTLYSRLYGQFNDKEWYKFWLDDVKIYIEYTYPIAYDPTVSKSVALLNEDITFYGSRSGGVSPFQYQWDFNNDGSYEETTSSSSITHSFSTIGDKTVRYRIKDDDNHYSESKTVTVTIHQEPTVSIDSVSPSEPDYGDSVSFQCSYDDDRTVTWFEWRSSKDGIFRQGNYEDPTYSDLSPGDHWISLRIKDYYDVWSDIVSWSGNPLHVETTPTIDTISVTPSRVTVDEYVTLNAEITELDGESWTCRWHSSISGYITNWVSTPYLYAQTQTTSDLSPGTHTLTLYVKDDHPSPTDSDSRTLTIGNRPTATIDDVSPNPAKEGIHSTIYFNGTGEEDSDSETVTTYLWTVKDKNNNELFTSASEDFTKPFDDLSIGENTITLKVRDSGPDWSYETTTTITLYSKPTALFDSMTPTIPIYGEDSISFAGSWIDDYGIKEYEWTSDIDDTFADSEDPTVSSTLLSSGRHTISFRVCNDHDIWSDYSTKRVFINKRPYAEIQSLSPELPTWNNDDISMEGTADDHDSGSVVTYSWSSNVSGVLGDTEDILVDATILTPGWHSITFRVMDNSSHWSNGSSMKLWVNDPPVPIIQEVFPLLPTKGINPTIYFNGTATDSDGDVLYYIWSSSLDGNISTSNSNKIDMNPEDLTTGNHTITFTVYDNSSGRNSTSIIIRINEKPTISAEVTPFNGVEEVDTFNFTAYGADDESVDRYEWNYSDEIISTVSSFSVPALNFSNGSHSIMVRCYDSDDIPSEWITLRFYVNGRPRIRNASISPDVATRYLDDLNLSCIAFDDVNISLHRWSSNVSGNFYNCSSSIVSISSHHLPVGYHDISVQVIDNGTGTSGWYSVREVFINMRPAIFANVTPEIGTEWLDVFEFTSNYTDDGEVSVFTWIEMGSNISYSNESSFSLNAEALENGTHTFGVECTDEHGVTSNRTEVFLRVNGRPIVISADVTGSPATRFRDTINLSVDSIDDSECILYEWHSKLDDWNSTSSSTTLTIEASDLSWGIHTFKVRAFDDDLADSEWFDVPKNITINEPPRILTCNITPEQSTRGRATINFSATHDDLDGIVVVTEWFNGEVLLNNVSSFELNSSNFDHGSYNITLVITDDQGGWSNQTIQILINEPPTVNITSILPSNARHKEHNVKFTGNATDIDGEIVQFLWRSNLSGILGTSSFLKIPAEELIPGNHTIILVVWDDWLARTVSDPFNITILGENLPPIAFIESIEPQTIYRDWDNWLNLSGTGWDHPDDLDGSAVKGEWTIDGETYSGWNRSISPRNFTLGNQTIYFRVLDDNGTWSRPVSDWLNVLMMNSLPIISNITISPRPAVYLEDEVIMHCEASDPDGTITRYIWNSSLDGVIGRDYEINISNLSIGIHEITITVEDDNGSFTYETTEIMVHNRPVATITENTPDTPIKGDDILLHVFGEGTDDDGIRGYEWRSGSNQHLSTLKNLTLLVDSLYQGNNQIKFRVKDVNGLWSNWTWKNISVNIAPKLKWNNTNPDSSLYQSNVTLLVDLSDSDKLVNNISWNSSIDDDIGYGNTITVGNLSLGTHTISISAFYDNGSQSEPCVGMLTVHLRPVATMIRVSPNYANRSTQVILFEGQGEDDNGINYYEWKSNISNNLSSFKNFGIISENMVPGIHNISFRVVDIFNIPSKWLHTTLYVNDPPEVTQANVSPNPVLRGELIQLSGYYIDNNDEIKKERWSSNIDGQLSSKMNITIPTDNLTIGRHTFTLRVKDGFGIWSRGYKISVDIHTKPIATIIDISPSIANWSTDLILFEGNGTDENGIGKYTWKSDRVGTLSMRPVFVLPARDLEEGNHTISFRVTDMLNEKSNWTNWTLTINRIPVVQILEMTPNPLIRDEILSLNGSISDKDEITNVTWISNIDGEIGYSDSIELNGSDLSIGEHIIQLCAYDSHGSVGFSKEAFLVVHTRPIAEIVNVSPTNLTIGEEDLLLNASGIDIDGNPIVAYLWVSDIDGVLRITSEENITISTLGMSPGIHNISLLVQDSHFIWSDSVLWNETITIISPYPPPSAFIKTLHPTLAVQKRDCIDFAGYGTPGEEIKEYLWTISGTNISSDKETFSLSAETIPVGVHVVTFLVMDIRDTWSTAVRVPITIKPPNMAPTISSTLVSPTRGTQYEDKFYFEATGYDDDQIIAWQWRYGNDVISSSRTFWISAESFSPGDEVVKVRAMDSFGLWSDYVFIEFSVEKYSVPIDSPRIERIISTNPLHRVWLFDLVEPDHWKVSFAKDTIGAQVIDASATSITITAGGKTATLGLGGNAVTFGDYSLQLQSYASTKEGNIQDVRIVEQRVNDKYHPPTSQTSSDLLVYADYDGYLGPDIGTFISNIDLFNAFYVEVQSDIDVNSILFEVEEIEYLDTNGDNGWTFRCNMGDLFWDPTLYVTALSESEDVLAYTEIQLHVLPLPQWLMNKAESFDISVEFNYDKEAYSVSIQIPEDPIVFEKTMDIPVFGGLDNSFNLSFYLGFRYYLEGYGEFFGGGNLTTELLGKEAEGEIAISGIVNNDLTFGGASVEASLDLNVFTIPKYTHIIPLPIAGGTLAVRFEIGADIFASINVEATINSIFELVFAQISPGVRVEAKTVCAIDFLAGLASAELHAQPTGELTFHITYTPEGVEGSVSASLTVPYQIIGSLFWGTISQEIYSGSFSFSYPKGSAEANSMNAIQLAINASNPENVNLHPSMDIATFNDTTVLVWIGDTSITETNPEIFSQFYINGSWGEVHQITDNEYFETNPRVSFDSNGYPMVIWTQNRLAVDEVVTDIETILMNQDIAFSVFDGEEWSTPSHITNDQISDGFVSLTSGPEGAMAAVWTSDLDGDILTLEDRVIRGSIYEGNWSDPEIMSVGGDYNPSIAWGDNSEAGVIVWIHDSDQNQSTYDDKEIIMCRFDSNSWGSSSRISAPTGEKKSPKVWSTRDGDFDIIFINSRDTSILYSLSLSSMETLDVINATTGIIEQPYLMKTSDDSTLVVWRSTHSSAEGDLYFSGRPASSSQWTPPRILTGNGLEFFFAVGIHSDETIILVYENFTEKNLGRKEDNLRYLSLKYLPELIINDVRITWVDENIINLSIVLENRNLNNGQVLLTIIIDNETMQEYHTLDSTMATIVCEQIIVPNGVFLLSISSILIEDFQEKNTTNNYWESMIGTNLSHDLAVNIEILPGSSIKGYSRLRLSVNQIYGDNSGELSAFLFLDGKLLLQFTILITNDNSWDVITELELTPGEHSLEFKLESDYIDDDESNNIMEITVQGPKHEDDDKVSYTVIGLIILNVLGVYFLLLFIRRLKIRGILVICLLLLFILSSYPQHAEAAPMNFEIHDGICDMNGTAFVNIEISNYDDDSFTGTINTTVMEEGDQNRSYFNNTHVFFPGNSTRTIRIPFSLDWMVGIHHVESIITCPYGSYTTEGIIASESGVRYTLSTEYSMVEPNSGILLQIIGDPVNLYDVPVPTLSILNPLGVYNDQNVTSLSENNWICEYRPESDGEYLVFVSNEQPFNISYMGNQLNFYVGQLPDLSIQLIKNEIEYSYHDHNVEFQLPIRIINNGNSSSGETFVDVFSSDPVISVDPIDIISIPALKPLESYDFTLKNHIDNVPTCLRFSIDPCNEIAESNKMNNRASILLNQEPDPFIERVSVVSDQGRPVIEVYSGNLGTTSTLATIDIHAINSRGILYTFSERVLLDNNVINISRFALNDSDQYEIVVVLTHHGDLNERNINNNEYRINVAATPRFKIEVAELTWSDLSGHTASISFNVRNIGQFRCQNATIKVKVNGIEMHRLTGITLNPTHSQDFELTSDLMPGFNQLVIQVEDEFSADDESVSIQIPLEKDKSTSNNDLFTLITLTTSLCAIIIIILYFMIRYRTDDKKNEKGNYSVFEEEVTREPDQIKNVKSHKVKRDIGYSASKPIKRIKRVKTASTKEEASDSPINTDDKDKRTNSDFVEIDEHDLGW